MLVAGKYIRQVKVLFLAQDGFFGVQTTQREILLDKKLRLGWKLIECGLKIINQGECDWFIKEGDG